MNVINANHKGYSIICKPYLDTDKWYLEVDGLDAFGSSLLNDDKMWSCETVLQAAKECINEWIDYAKAGKYHPYFIKKQ
jgi:hypothetical protein